MNIRRVTNTNPCGLEASPQCFDCQCCSGHPGHERSVLVIYEDGSNKAVLGQEAWELAREWQLPCFV